jgi:hypothetical protein
MVAWHAIGIETSLSIEQARAVREMRIDWGFTWRRVAEEFFERFADVDYDRGLAGNQFFGMELCRAAARQLGEEPDSEPWN